ncbi:hypothetical protein Hanom_Chr11g01034681 [Helianthus anomalus]
MKAGGVPALRRRPKMLSPAYGFLLPHDGWDDDVRRRWWNRWQRRPPELRLMLSSSGRSCSESHISCISRIIVVLG